MLKELILLFFSINTIADKKNLEIKTNSKINLDSEPIDLTRQLIYTYLNVHSSVLNFIKDSQNQLV